MADAHRATDALLTEHFRYTPLTLIDDIINAVNTIVYRGIEAIENGLLNIPAKTLGFKESGEDAQAEIEHGVHQLETLLEATVDKAFDKFEIYTLRNILTVPDDVAGWVRLRHYENLTFPNPDSNSPSPESLLQLRRELAETRKLNASLRATHAKNAALISDLHALLAPAVASSPQTTTTTTSQQPAHPSSLAFLTALAPGASTTPGATPLTTNAQFVESQLPALRQLVGELRPRLQKMRLDGDGKVDWDGGKEERRRYIEGGVVRVVGTRGSGDLRDGRERRAGEEVEGLEAVVGEMGN